MVKALLCDIDGTLVQSNWLHAEAWQTAFAAIGIALDKEDVRRQIGKGGDELIPVYGLLHHFDQSALLREGLR